MVALHELSAVEQRVLLERYEITATELTEHYLDRIGRLNPTLRAFTTVTAERALARSRELDLAAKRHGRPSLADAPLWGIPFADKDLNDRKGVVSTYGSRPFADYTATSTSAIVAILDDAGGVSLGKSNVPEFGFPAYGRNALPQGFARNPWDLSLDPGGSSAGAATAVAARMLPVAPGNDAGGSIRIPAAACGLVGLKPTRGRVPAESGIGALAGLPVGGPLARSVGDAALLLDAMVRGPSRFALRPPRASGMPPSGSFLEALQRPLGALRIGWNLWSPWASEYEISVGSDQVAALEQTLGLAESMGHTVEEVLPRPAPDYIRSFREVWMASAASLPLPDELLDAVEPLTKWLVQTGRKRSAADLARALMALAVFEEQLIEDYSEFDLVLTPALAMGARPEGWFDERDGELNFIQQCQFTPFTSYVNVAGLPAMSLPVAMTDNPAGAPSLPVGVQAIGRAGDEATLLRFGLALEKEFSWQNRVPAVLR